MSAFDAAFAVVVGHEGRFSDNAADPGNWTGGRCGAGELRGTCWGLSAASYPSLWMRGLALDAAKVIYRRDYWDPISADSLPAPLALLVFDAAVNNGRFRATHWLQGALGVTRDGVIGPKTLAAVTARHGDGVRLLAEFQAQRLLFMSRLPTWSTFGLGWSRRLCLLPYEALRLA